MVKRDCNERTPSEIKSARKFENKNFENFSERSAQLLRHPLSIFKGLTWEPETPESTLPSYLAVKRSFKFDRKAWDSVCILYLIKVLSEFQFKTLIRQPLAPPIRCFAELVKERQKLSKMSNLKDFKRICHETCRGGSGFYYPLYKVNILSSILSSISNFVF